GKVSMRRVVMQTFASLEEFAPARTAALGRVTYRMFAGYRPTVRTGEEESFADKFNSKNKVVFSHTLERAPWALGAMRASYESSLTVTLDAGGADDYGAKIPPSSYLPQAVRTQSNRPVLD